MNSTLIAQEDVASFDALSDTSDIDLVEEMRLRTWARRNYVSAADRDDGWHPIILDEMVRVDDEPLAL